MAAGAVGVAVLPGSPRPALAIPSLCDAISGNLVANCGFETGNFDGWKTIPASRGSHFGVESGHPHSGNDNAFFMALAFQSDTISQAISTTAGATYDVAFWLANDNPNNAFQATFGGDTLLSFSDRSPFAYTMFSQTVTATSGSTMLSFAGQSSMDTLFLDDVSVVAAPAVPEPDSLALVGSALLGLAAVRAALARRRRAWCIRL